MFQALHFWHVALPPSCDALSSGWCPVRRRRTCTSCLRVSRLLTGGGGRKLCSPVVVFDTVLYRVGLTTSSLSSTFSRAFRLLASVTGICLASYPGGLEDPSLPCFARASALVLPTIPTCPGIHWKVTVRPPCAMFASSAHMFAATSSFAFCGPPWRCSRADLEWVFWY